MQYDSPVSYTHLDVYKRQGYVYMQGGPFEKTALSDVNLDIKQGEFIGLIGHTG